MFKGKLLYILGPIVVIGIFVGFFWLTSQLVQMNANITYIALFVLIVLLQFDWGKIVRKLRHKKPKN